MADFIILGLALSLATALPLAWKWALGIRRTAVVIVALSVITGQVVVAAVVLGYPNGVVSKALLNWLLTLGVAFSLTMYRFYRDPERKVPLNPNVVVSPADGEILYVRRLQHGALPTSTKNGRSYPLMELTKTPLHMKEATVIGVGMSFLDVHVNRAPIAGRIASRKHTPGRFLSLRAAEAVIQNERMTTVIERGDLQVAVVQIASRLVRQIVSFVHEGQDVALGQRMGIIRFGSQVDLVLPRRADLAVMVKPGDRLKAGESIVAVRVPQNDRLSD